MNTDVDLFASIRWVRDFISKSTHVQFVMDPSECGVSQVAETVSIWKFSPKIIRIYSLLHRSWSLCVLCVWVSGMNIAYVWVFKELSDSKSSIIPLLFQLFASWRISNSICCCYRSIRYNSFDSLYTNSECFMLWRKKRPKTNLHRIMMDQKWHWLNVFHFGILVRFIWIRAPNNFIYSNIVRHIMTEALIDHHNFLFLLVRRRIDSGEERKKNVCVRFEMAPDQEARIFEHSVCACVWH